ncbi:MULTISPECIES: hypothetical protein [Cobetia]|uniref:hypothetical protein n=1 Tax=Cobetia TaxID=204286 RepID=UPI001582FE16|nr:MULTISPECIES: hypothetical protein [Cobetia]MDI4662466.1 hypothetical protein [Cobetia sp. BMC6]NUJ57621.1 hypothetical protein [Cobetia marina]
MTHATRTTVNQHLLTGLEVEVLPETPLISETGICAVYPSNRQLAPKVRAFLDYFSEYFGSPPYWDVQQD